MNPVLTVEVTVALFVTFDLYMALYLVLIQATNLTPNVALDLAVTVVLNVAF